MDTGYRLHRFLDAQDKDYNLAWSELSRGHKQSHWMWYIFPQIAGLGQSETSKYYAIRDLQEAEAYIKHPVLGPRLIDISRLLLAHWDKEIHQIFDSPDDRKLQSAITLFAETPKPDPVFQSVLDRFFGGMRDKKTLQLLAAQKI